MNLRRFWGGDIFVMLHVVIVLRHEETQNTGHAFSPMCTRITTMFPGELLVCFFSNDVFEMFWRQSVGLDEWSERCVQSAHRPA